ncbi:hypothetical protein SCALM49S_05698 [Streptomyces californicus]
MNVPGTTDATSSSASRPQAVTVLPLRCRDSPSAIHSPGGTGTPSSSVNSRRAAASALSSGPYSPFGTDQAASSRPAQNGPPMCPISTSTSRSPAASSVTRKSRSPALRLLLDMPSSLLRRRGRRQAGGRAYADGLPGRARRGARRRGTARPPHTVPGRGPHVLR